MAQLFLREQNPELYAQLVNPDPRLRVMSNKRVLWRCEKGHEWDAVVASRSRGANCPYCSGRRRIVGVNDLATTHPDIAAQLVDASLATELAASSLRKVSWRCEKGHEWVASVFSRTQGNGCPICSNHKVVAGVNDIATTHPDIAAQLVEPEFGRKVSYGSTCVLRWRCERGHEWNAMVANRICKGQGCPTCAELSRAMKKSGDMRSVRARGEHDLARRFPHLAAQLVDKSLVSELSSYSSRRVEWECERGHRWFALVRDRAAGTGCPYCASKRVLVGFNDLATTHPDVAALLVDAKAASQVTAGSHKRLRWRCEHGHEWEASVKDVVRGRRCPVCINKKVVAGVNDLATLRPQLAAQLVDQTLGTKLSMGSDRRVEWRCEQGHTWSSLVRSRALRDYGCPYCSGNKVASGETDLATTHPDIAAELVDQSLATRLSAGSSRVVRWRCERGHEWDASVSNRVGLGSGCPTCACGEHASEPERSLADVVRGLLPDGTEVFTNDRKLIAPKELDIVVPSVKLAIEFNGVWWHSEGHGRGRRYHEQKFKACEAAGYQLVTVWEDTWNSRRDVVVRMLAAKLGVSSQRRVFARKLDFGEVTGKVARPFMDANHIQGFVSATRHFALFEAGVPVAMMSVRSPRSAGRMRRAEGSWEIVRYATSAQVVGGFSKLLSHVQETLVSEGVTLTQWVSFSDNEVSDGGMYERCGFVLDAELNPDYKYAGAVTGNVRRPKESFQKSCFRDRPELEYKDGLTERELADLNGLVRCWDCGKRRWVRSVG